MKKALILLICLFYVFPPATAAAFGEISVESAVVSRYIWRGFDVTSNNKPALQPSVTFTDQKTGIYFNFWNSTGFDRNATKGVDEWDFAVGYSKKLTDLVEVSVGYIYYTFPNYNTANISHEFNAGIALGTVLSPSITAYYDAELGTGLYLLGAVSQGLGSSPVSVGAAFGYNSEMFIDKSGFSDITLSIGIDIPLPYKNVSLSPSVNYTMIPDNMKGAGGLSDENELWISLGFGISL